MPDLVPVNQTGGTDAQREDAFFQQLDVVGDRMALIKTLTHDVLRLEAERGRNAIELGRKLKLIRDTLSVDGKVGKVWAQWCETFVYKQNYASRMIQVAEMFDAEMPGVASLSLQHLREVARFSDKDGFSEEDRARLAKIAEENRIGAKQLRYLVSETKAGNINFEQFLTENPDVNAELDRRMRAAKEEGRAEERTRAEELQAEIEEMDKQSKDLCDQLNQKNDKIEKLQKDLKMSIASTKLGDGDPQVGKLKIELEQASQQKDNLQLQLGETQKELIRMQTEHAKWVNSPAGQAKLDLGKVMSDITKFFKDTMTPAYLALKVNDVGTDEAKAEVIKVIDAIEDWATRARLSLEGVEILKVEEAPE